MLKKEKIDYFLKLEKEIAPLIKSGEKKYEFRKLEKGITTGTAAFLDLEKLEKDGLWVDLRKGVIGKDGKVIDNWKDYLLFTAKLTPIVVNPLINKWNSWEGNGEETLTIDILKNHPHKMYEVFTFSIHKISYDFVKENYIDKNIDFIVYEISEVKEKEKWMK